ncbi:MAG: hypothetical protein SOZ00_08430 [Tidjanibacter sp.]|nr:hypothetical protein [Tidjanibacter sp.]
MSTVQSIATAILGAIPELRGKVMVGMPPAEAGDCPLVSIAQPSTEPVFAKNGIAGYITSIDIYLIDSSKNNAEQTKHRLIKAIVGIEIENNHLYFDSLKSTSLSGGRFQTKLSFQLS